MSNIDQDDVGPAIYALIERLFPICRSITGDGVRRTLDIIGEHIPLERHEVPTGTAVFDWTIPQEWNIRAAYIKGPDGRTLVDFADSNLHVVSYSTPIRARMSLAELMPHLHSLPEHPEWIPYRTSYYNPGWGFCLPHRQLQSLTAGEYEVVIDSELKDGALSYAECRVPGRSDDEVLVFAHICHPSLCNDNLSGIGIAVQLAKYLASAPRRYSYRFVFAPATIGSITWLSRNESRLGRIKHGLVASVLGDAGKLHYKKTRRGDAEIDRAVQCVLRDRGGDFEILEFSPWGYDERQFGSPGIALPVGRLTRTPNGCYPEYHSSADDLDLVQPASLADSYRAYAEVFAVLEHNRCCRNLSPKGEPQLGRRGLYRKTGGQQDLPDRELALLWVLNQSDGATSLLEIAERSGLGFASIAGAASDLEAARLLETVPGR